MMLHIHVIDVQQHDQTVCVFDPFRSPDPAHVRLSQVVLATEWQPACDGQFLNATWWKECPLRVLFVCTGNTCRSPMAEAIFRNLFSERLGCPEEDLRRHGYDILSAGLAAGNNIPASKEAVELLRDRGIDLSDHLSRQVTSEILSECDQVYAMTSPHLVALQDARPDLIGRMQLITRNGQDVSDPIGRGTDAYRECADQLTEAILRIADDLIRKDDKENENRHCQ